MGIYREEAMRVAPMYYIGIETHEEKEILTATIENALMWGGFKKPKESDLCYFSGYSPSVNAAIVSKAMGVPMSAIISNSPFAFTARRIIAYMSSKNNSIGEISAVLLVNNQKAIWMVRKIQSDIDNQDVYTIRMIEKVIKEIENYKLETI